MVNVPSMYPVIYNLPHSFRPAPCPSYSTSATNDGPFQVIHRADKFFKEDLGTHIDNVSIDRLKPAFMDVLPILASPGSQSPLATTSVPSQHRLSRTALPFVPSTPFSGLTNSGYVTKQVVRKQVGLDIPL